MGLGYHALVRVVVVLALSVVNGGKLVGRYDMRITEMHECPKEEIPLDGSNVMNLTGILHHNKTVRGRSVFTGDLDIRGNAGHKQYSKMSVRISKWDSVSGWRQNFMRLNLGEVCFVYETILADFIALVHKTVDNFPEKCPLVNGIYHIRSLPIITGTIRHFPEMPYGTFRFDIVFTRMASGPKDLPFFCKRLVTVITPKAD